MRKGLLLSLFSFAAKVCYTYCYKYSKLFCCDMSVKISVLKKKKKNEIYILGIKNICMVTLFKHLLLFLI